MVQDALRSFRLSSLLDVGCGAADIPLALAREARKRGRDLQITCVDSSPLVLAIARKRSNDPALHFAQSDGTSLPFEDRSFDVVMCNLTLHHCEPPVAIALLKEMRRVARQGCLVTDLQRSRVVWLGAKILAAMATRNRLSRHDAPLSVLRAYTPAEALGLARAAGWPAPRFARAPIGRMAFIDA